MTSRFFAAVPEQLRAVGTLLVACGVALWVSTASAWVAIPDTVESAAGKSVAVDPAGDVIAGSVKLSAADGHRLWSYQGPEPQLPPGLAVVDPSGDVAGTQGYWVVKLRGSDGVELWRRFENEAASLAVDLNGDVVVGRSGGIDKLSASGNAIWQMPGGDRTMVAVDGRGDVLAVGRPDSGGGYHLHKRRGSDGLRLWTYDQVLWASGLAVAPNGDVVIVGISPTSLTVAVGKVSTYGAELWRHEMPGMDALAQAEVDGLAVDGAGDVVVVGRFLDNLSDAFAIKLAGADGSELWRVIVNTALDERFGAVAVDFAENVLIGGLLPYNDNLFTSVLKFTSNGDYLWGVPGGGDLYGAGEVVALAVDAYGNPVLYSQFGAGERVVKLNGSTGADYVAVCGNGSLEAGEHCDDGNLASGDGCDAQCQLEPATSSGSGTVTTGAATTPAEPVQATVTSPSGGAVTITRLDATPTESGYSMLGSLFEVSAPDETPESPLLMVFVVDGSLAPPGATIQVFKNGVAVPDCTGNPGEASPDPCVESRTPLDGGTVEIRILTSTASEWSFGSRFGADPLPPLTATLSPISGKKLLIKDNVNAAKRKLLFMSKDPAIDTRAGSGIDPVSSGAFLQVYNNGTGESVCLSLAPGGWQATGSDTDRVYKYKDKAALNSPCSLAIVKTAKLLKVSCQAKVLPIDYSLDEPAQGSVGVNFISGGIGYCALFGGTIKKDSGTNPPNPDGKGLFKAMDAAAPAQCPTPPSACP